VGSARDVVPACVWPVSADLLMALDERFGEPVDAYLNGAQVWLRDDGPGGSALEWRLHPVAGYRKPEGVSHHDVLASVVYALRAGDELPASPEELWDGLEAFPGYGDEMEPATLAAACTEALGVPPQAYGLVDHAPIADAWEASGGTTSVVQAILDQLG
jgi:hypothetical protein